MCEGQVCKGQVCEIHSDPGLPNDKVLSLSRGASPVSPFTVAIARPPSSLHPQSDAQSPSLESKAPFAASCRLLQKVAFMEVFPLI